VAPKILSRLKNVSVRTLVVVILFIILSVGFASFFSSSPFPPDPSAVLALNFSFYNRTNLTDSSSHGNNGTFTEGTFNDGDLSGVTLNDGTITEAVYNTSGVFGNAMSFDGIDDYVDVGDPSSLDFGTGDFSVAFWIFSHQGDNSITNARVMSKGGGSSSSAGYGIFQNLQSGGVTFYISDGEGGGDGVDRILISGGTVAQNEWHHIVMQRSSSTSMEIYVDGVLISTGTPPDGSIDTSSSLIFGALSTTSLFWNGTLDDIKIFDRGLNGTEINETMEGTFIRHGLVGYWRFDEEEGSTVYDSHYISKGNSTSITNARYRNAIAFDAVDDWVDTNIDAAFDFAADQDFSYTLWIKTNTTATENVIDKRGESGGASDFDGFTLFVHSLAGSVDIRAIFADGTDTVGVQVNMSIFDNKWHHIAVTADRDDVASMYIDGVLMNTSSITDIGSLANDNTLAIGVSQAHSPNDFYFNGSIDELAIWNRVLTEDEVNQSMNSDRVIANGGLLAYWSFDKEKGTRISDEVNRRWGIHGSAMHFDGIDDYIQIDANDASFDFEANTAGKESYAAWFYSTGSGSNQNIIQHERGILTLGTDTLLLSNIGNSACTGSIEISNNTWTHGAVTYDGTNVRTYVNGILDATCARTLEDQTGVNLEIGSTNGATQFFNGSIDEVRIYNVTLTLAQIQEIYSCQAPTFPHPTWNINGVCTVDSENVENKDLILTLNDGGNLTLTGTNITIKKIAVGPNSRVAIDADSRYGSEI
jgi:hypothetical protein